MLIFKEEFRGNISNPTLVISYGKESVTEGWGEIPCGRSQEAGQVVGEEIATRGMNHSQLFFSLRVGVLTTVLVLCPLFPCPAFWQEVSVWFFYPRKPGLREVTLKRLHLVNTT